jgi:hypothetical protein
MVFRHVVSLLLLWTLAMFVCASTAESLEDPTYEGTGVRYHVFKLVPIPKVPDDEVRTDRPSPGQVWIPGYWERTPDDWRWVRGRWALPPDANATWQAGHWRNEGDAWDWTTGGWIVTESYDARKEVQPGN